MSKDVARKDVFLLLCLDLYDLANFIIECCRWRYYGTDLFSSVLFSVDYFIVQLQITDMLHFNFFTGIKSEN